MDSHQQLNHDRASDRTRDNAGNDAKRGIIPPRYGAASGSRGGCAHPRQPQRHRSHLSSETVTYNPVNVDFSRLTMPERLAQTNRWQRRY
jgi:hypothetical protein